jgi:hypothetical protein
MLTEKATERKSQPQMKKKGKALLAGFSHNPCEKVQYYRWAAKSAEKQIFAGSQIQAWDLPRICAK